MGDGSCKRVISQLDATKSVDITVGGPSYKIEIPPYLIKGYEYDLSHTALKLQKINLKILIYDDLKSVINIRKKPTPYVEAKLSCAVKAPAMNPPKEKPV